MSCNNPSGRGCINPIACSHDGFCEFPSPRLTEAITKTCQRIEEAGARSTKVAAKLKANRTDPAAVEAWEVYGPAIFHCDMTGPQALQSYGDQREADARADERARCARVAETARTAYEKRARNGSHTRNERTRCSHYAQALAELAAAFRAEALPPSPPEHTLLP